MASLNKLGNVISTLVLCMASSFANAGFEDPIAVPAQSSALASKSPLVAVSHAGKRLVAVGQRGHVVLSDDGAGIWTQGQVPVSNDLLAVHFSSPQNGWAVGQGGVVIRSRDGGLTWDKQLDGQQASKLILDYYTRAADNNTLQDAQGYIEREQSLIGFGGTQPFMGVYFETSQRGYVVGTFNRILRTEDGGTTWEPMMHRVENPSELHIYNIAVGAAGLYMVGEQGMVWKYDRQADRFVARSVGYDGTLFGIVVAERVLVAYGMRGSVYRSVDQGDSWQRVELGSQAGVTGGALLAKDGIILTNLAGSAFYSGNNAESFKAFPIASAMSYFGVLSFDEKRLALVGAEGIRVGELGDLQGFNSNTLAGFSTRRLN